MLCYKQRLQEQLRTRKLTIYLVDTGVPRDPFCILSRYLRVTGVSPLNLYTSPEWGSKS